MIKKLLYIFLLIIIFASCRDESQELIHFNPDINMDGPELYCDSAILADYETGRILYDKNSNEIIPPASMTKLVVNYIVFKEIEKGNLFLDDYVLIDSESDFRNQPPRSSLMFIEEGQKVTLRECLIGLAIPSGNDAAVAVAKHVSGDVESFIKRMNSEMKALGLEKTRFSDTSGYSELNQTTAGEFLIFIRKYAELFPGSIEDFHSLKSFAYPKRENYGNNKGSVHGTIVQNNHNALIGRVSGVNGLKTGYIDESGFNVALSAEKNRMKLIAVIMGSRAKTPAESRIRGSFDASVLLTYGFSSFRTIEISPEIKKNVRVYNSRNKYADINYPESVKVTVPAEKLDDIYYKFEIKDILRAPLEKGSRIGFVKIYADDEIIESMPVEIAEDIEYGGFFRAMLDELKVFFRYSIAS